LKTIACIGTGPSLTLEQVDMARAKGCHLYVCNNAFQLAPDAELLYAVNSAWWDYYYQTVKNLPCEKWTTNIAAAQKHHLNWIAERNAPGLSQDKNIIHHGHGSGFSLVSMAHRAGADRIVLLGYDMKYAPDYNGKARQVGSSPRHFFGEYPASMQHWPSAQVRRGFHVELIELYQSVAEQNLIQVINCTPDSAIDCFERKDISAI